ncbi:DNase I-like protein [Pseudohyphozyma bogoriensis]|nr:DNase I-like protein [Pseudohyphozyma bogoriensis]
MKVSGLREDVHEGQRIVGVFEVKDRMVTVDSSGLLAVWDTDVERRKLNSLKLECRTFHIPQKPQWVQAIDGRLWTSYSPPASKGTPVAGLLRVLGFDKGLEVVSEPDLIFMGHVGGIISVWERKRIRFLYSHQVSTDSVTSLLGPARFLWVGCERMDFFGKTGQLNVAFFSWNVDGIDPIHLATGSSANQTLLVDFLTSAQQPDIVHFGFQEMIDLSSLTLAVGILIRFVLEDSSFCFINCHLASGQKHPKERERDIIAILDTRSRFPRPSAATRSAYVSRGDGTQVADHEQTFFCATYDTSKKQRTPSWCDRILYRSEPTTKITPVLYRRYEADISDHRPISASFTCQVKSVDRERREKVYKTVLREWAKVRQSLLEEARSYYPLDF